MILESCCIGMTLTVSVVIAFSGLCYNIRRSRCTRIETPCITIEREVMNKEEMQADQLPSTSM